MISFQNYDNNEFKMRPVELPEKVESIKIVYVHGRLTVHVNCQPFYVNNDVGGDFRVNIT